MTSVAKLKRGRNAQSIFSSPAERACTTRKTFSGSARAAGDDIVEVNKRNISRYFAEISFFVLYPAFFFYNAAIAFGYIPPIFGGLYGLYCLVLTSVSAINVSVSRSVTPLGTWIDKLFNMFVGWCLLWMLVNYALDYNPYVDASSYNLLNFIFQLVANFLIGCFLYNNRTKWFADLILVSWFCMFFFALVTFDPVTLSVHGALYWGDDKDLADPKSFATYQGFARSALLTSFIIVARMKQFVTRVVIEVISLIILFLLSARSELVGFLCAVMLLEILVSLKNARRIANLAFLGVITISLLYFSSSVFPDVSGSRISLLADLDKDRSWQIRREFSNRAFAQILDNPLFGKYGGEYDEWLGQEGTYAHNILSAWVSLGLPGFLLYLSLLVGSFLVAMRKVNDTKGNSESCNFLLLSSCTALLLSFTAKSVTESWFGLVFGLVLSVTREEWRSKKHELRGPWLLGSRDGSNDFFFR
jgi:hypothetical protein